MKLNFLISVIFCVLLFGCSQGSIPTDAPVIDKESPSITLQPTSTQAPATSTLRPTETEIPTAIEIVPGAVLFEEDFEDGKADNLAFTWGEWKVDIENNGNEVFEIDTNTETDIKNDINASFGFGSKEWMNYSVEYRVKMLNSQANVVLKFRSDLSDNSTHYVEWLSAEYDTISLHSSINFDGWLPLKNLDYPVWDERWYRVKVEAQGPRLRVYLDDNLMLQTDDSRITHGGFSLDVFPGTHALFDDIRVIALDETP